METYFISAWALTLSVQQDKAMREPRCVERTKDDSTLFLCPYLTNREIINFT